MIFFVGISDIVFCFLVKLCKKLHNIKRFRSISFFFVVFWIDFLNAMNVYHWSDRKCAESECTPCSVCIFMHVVYETITRWPDSTRNVNKISLHLHSFVNTLFCGEERFGGAEVNVVIAIVLWWRFILEKWHLCVIGH